MRTTLSAREVDLIGGEPFWPTLDRKASKYRALDDDLECDVAVIGGGITGALVSNALVEAGADVVLIDKARFGGASTSASTAMISYEFDEMLVDLARHKPMKSAVCCYELCFEAVRDFAKLVKRVEVPCDYDAKASIRIDTTGRRRSQFESEAKIKEKHGFATKFLERDVLLNRFGLSAYCGLESTNAAQIDPLQFTKALIAFSVSQGMRAFEESKITTFDSERSGVGIRTSAGRNVRARRVVFATGYESEKYFKKRLALLTTDFCFVSHPLKDLKDLEKCHFVEQTDNYLYASSFGDRVIMGVQDAAFFPPKRRQELLKRKADRLLERSRIVLPQHNLNPEFRWAGTFAKSRDSFPYLAEIEQFPHAYFVLGYGGNGIASSAMLAPIVCDLALGRKNADAKLFAVDRA